MAGVGWKALSVTWYLLCGVSGLTALAFAAAGVSLLNDGDIGGGVFSFVVTMVPASAAYGFWRLARRHGARARKTPHRSHAEAGAASQTQALPPASSRSGRSGRARRSSTPLEGHHEPAANPTAPAAPELRQPVITSASDLPAWPEAPGQAGR